jgi:hypothetical protein
MLEKIIRDFMTIWTTVDPISNLALFAGLTAAMHRSERRRAAWRASLYAVKCTGFWLFSSSRDNDKILRIVAIMCATVPRSPKFISARQRDGNLVHTLAFRLHPAGISRF